MLLVLDVGNSNIKTGLYEDGKLRNSWRMTTARYRTADEYGIQMESFFRHLRLSKSAVDGVIFSSVVPSLNYTVEHMCSLYFDKTPAQVSAALSLGIDIRYDDPGRLGSDRICNAVAAYARYGASIIVDFGTATTFTVINAKAELIGGLICPGIIVSTDALIDRAAMLQKVEFIKPARVIGANTSDNVQSGLIHGFVGQVDYIIRQIRREIGVKNTVVATGGMSAMIADETGAIDKVEPTLTLDGLALIYERNYGKKTGTMKTMAEEAE